VKMKRNGEVFWQAQNGRQDCLFKVKLIKELKFRTVPLKDCLFVECIA
jgi:hypothetical protein